MLVLGIDTATPWGTVALCEGGLGGDGETLFEISFKINRGGGEYLLSTLDMFLKKAGRRFAEIGLIAVGTGPGSYTGIRVGLAAAKGLAEGLQKPALGIDTLRIIAENALFTPESYIAAVIDARHGEVYTALYRKTGDFFTEIEQPRIIAAQELATRLAVLPDVIVCGDGSKVYQDIWKHHNLITGPSDWNRPSAGKLAQIASREWNPDFQPDPAELKACYLRRVEAEIRLEEKLHATNHQPNDY